MKKASILVNYVGRRGGGPVYTFCMCKGLKNNGADIYLLTSKGIELKNDIDKAGFKDVFYLPSYSSNLTCLLQTFLFHLFYKFKIKYHYKNIHFDMIYLPMETLWGGMICKLFKKRNVPTLTTTHDPKPHSTNHNISRKIADTFFMSSIPFSTHLIVLSECFKKTTMDLHNQFADNVLVIPHGNMDYYFDMNAQKIHQYPKSDYHILFFGRIDAYKGIPVLCSAIKILQQNGFDISLSIVGSGDFSVYKDCIKEINKCEVINRWIKDEEVASYFRSSNVILVLPYIDATQSGVIPLAMKGGCPIVASNTGGLIEQIKDRQTGLIFKCNDSKDLASKITEIIKDKVFSHQLIKNAKDENNKHNWDILSMKILNVIK